MSRTDLERLMNTMVPRAKEMLRRYGDFEPFGACMTREGRVDSIFGDETDQQPDSQERFDELLGSFRAQAAAGELKAAGICMDVRVFPPSQTRQVTAIRTSLEDDAGEALDIFVPYRRGLFGRIRFDASFGTKGASMIFDGGRDASSRAGPS